MIIEILKPELEDLIRERMATGEFQDVEDFLIQALKSSLVDAAVMSQRQPRQPLGQFLLESPLRGSGIKIERQKDYPRPIDL